MIGLVAGGAILATRGDDSLPSSTAPSTTATGSQTMIVSGTFTLTSANLGSGGGGCWGEDGFDDIGPSTQVVIRDSSERTIGVGTLDSGVLSNDVVCQYRFSVGNVPRGLGIYSVEVSHRGEIRFSEDQAQALAVTLSD